jgi:hypothetical protein
MLQEAEVSRQDQAPASSSGPAQVGVRKLYAADCFPSLWLNVSSNLEEFTSLRLKGTIRTAVVYLPIANSMHGN